MKKNLVKKLGAYTLAAGAAAVAANATPANAALMRYHQPFAGAWYDADSDWNQDLLTFKMDGTVVLNSGDIPGTQVLGQNDDSFTFAEMDFFWYGYDEKDAVTLNIGANVGYVAGGNVWNVGRLGGSYLVGATLADGRIWSDDSVTDTGGLGGWYFYFHGEWPFGGGGYIGLYADDIDGRHYGWAQVNMTAYWAIELIQFAFESEVDTPVHVPEPMTLSVLALGATDIFLEPFAHRPHIHTGHITDTCDGPMDDVLGSHHSPDFNGGVLIHPPRESQALLRQEGLQERPLNDPHALPTRELRRQHGRNGLPQGGRVSPMSDHETCKIHDRDTR